MICYTFFVRIVCICLLTFAIVLLQGSTLAQATDSGFTSFTNSDRVYDTVRIGDTLWCATISALVKWDLSDSSYVKYTAAEGFPGTLCYSVDVDSKGIVWVAHYGGVSSFDGETFTTYTEADGVKLYGHELVISDDDTVWVTAYRGAACYKDGEWTGYDDEAGFINRVLDVTIVPSGIVWIGADNGLFSFDGESWQHYTAGDGFPYKHVNVLDCDNDGNLWIGSYEEIWAYDSTQGAIDNISTGTNTAVTRYDGLEWKTFEWESDDPNKYIRDICASGDTIWISTLDKIMPIDKETVTNSDPDIFTYDLTCDGITLDAEGTLWFSSWTGLYRRESVSLVYYPMNDSTVCVKNDVTQRIMMLISRIYINIEFTAIITDKTRSFQVTGPDNAIIIDSNFASNPDHIYFFPPVTIKPRKPVMMRCPDFAIRPDSDREHIIRK